MGVPLMLNCNTLVQAHQSMCGIRPRQPSDGQQLGAAGLCICLSAQTRDQLCLQVLARRRAVQRNGTCLGTRRVAAAI